MNKFSFLCNVWQNKYHCNEYGIFWIDKDCMKFKVILENYHIVHIVIRGVEFSIYVSIFKYGSNMNRKTKLHPKKVEQYWPLSEVMISWSILVLFSEPNKGMEFKGHITLKIKYWHFAIDFFIYECITPTQTTLYKMNTIYLFDFIFKHFCP